MKGGHGHTRYGSSVWNLLNRRDRKLCYARVRQVVREQKITRDAAYLLVGVNEFGLTEEQIKNPPVGVDNYYDETDRMALIDSPSLEAVREMVAGSGDADLRRDVLWVNKHLYTENVSLTDAPSADAYTMWRYASATEANRGEFLKNFVKPLLPTKDVGEEMAEERRAQRDVRKSIELIDELKSVLEGVEGSVVQVKGKYVI